MLIRIVLAVAIIVVLFLIVVATRPADFQVTRSETIAAPVARVFEQVNDFHKWPAWSPWASIDPAMKQTYEGAPEGEGAVYSWAGNSQVGSGRMTITESRAPELVRIHLEFMKPFPGICPTVFTFKAEENGTLVTWTMTGRHTLIPKAVAVFVSMDKMIGTQFEKGLAQMKAVAESPRPAAPTGERVDSPSQPASVPIGGI